MEYSEGRFRFNPLVDWTQADLTAYIEENGLPKHPLVNDGYPSIGCMPCTRRVAAGEGYRDGRWAGFDKDECGIHAASTARAFSALPIGGRVCYIPPPSHTCAVVAER